MDLKTFQHNAYNYSHRGRITSAFLVSSLFIPICYIYLHFSHFEFRTRSSWGGNTGDIMASIVMAMPLWLVALALFMLIRRGGIVPKFLPFRATGSDLYEYFSDTKHRLSQRMKKLKDKSIDDAYFVEIRKVSDEYSELIRHSGHIPKEEFEETVSPKKKKKKPKRKPKSKRPTKRWKK